MKRILSSVFIVVSVLANVSVYADQITHPVDYICPSVSSLGHFETYIAGMGSEILSSRTTNTIYFKSRNPLRDIPSSLINYSNSGTNYDGPTGYVTCSFASSNPAESNFDISYNITNGKGGQIQLRTSNSIRVLFFVGLNK
jgi:hypothetical protein